MAPFSLQFVPTAEGYYDFVQNKYIYQYKDQIGNVRLAYYKDAAGNVVTDRVTDFYPFGLAFGSDTGLNAGGSISPAYRYGYQSQELQSDTGWESFKWRNYDPTYARFFNADPLSEEYAYQSHYNFSENSVVNSRELEGLERVIVLGRGAAAAGAAGVAARGRSVGKLTPDWLDNGLKNVNHRNNIITATAIATAMWGANEIKNFTNRVLNSEGNSKGESKKEEQKKKETGSYTNTHESGKRYHGKGDKKRAEKSAKEKAEKHNDPQKETDWTPAENDREAFKDESKRIETDKVGDTPGHKNPNNYNNRRSPGDKFRQQDGN